jgi:hypothetical protein
MQEGGVVGVRVGVGGLEETVVVALALPEPSTPQVNVYVVVF